LLRMVINKLFQIFHLSCDAGILLPKVCIAKTPWLTSCVVLMLVN
jgi:hypothetical protein